MVLPFCGRVSNAPASPVVRQLQYLCSKGTGLYMAQRSVQNCLREYYQLPQRVEGGGERGHSHGLKCHPLEMPYAILVFRQYEGGGFGLANHYCYKMAFKQYRLEPVPGIQP
jgi:hypothetical protein